MTEDVSAGRLHLDAYVDTSGVTRGLQRRIDAETKAIRAKIRAEIDTRGVVTAARKSALEASKTAKVRLKTELDTRGLVAQAKAAAAQIQQQVVVKVRAEVDQASVKQAKAAIADATKGEKVDVGVDVDTKGAEAQTEAWRQRERVKSVKVPVEADTSALSDSLSTFGDALAQFSAIPAIIGGVYTLGSAVVQLGGGLVSMASAASQAVTVLAAIPSLAGMAAQGIGALMLGFSGIGDAVGALGQKQATAAKDTKKSADAQVQAARRITDARYALGQAIHQQADDERASARSIANAQYAVAQAHRDEHDAVTALTDARKAARAEVKKLNDELRLSAGDETVAMNAVIKAREDLQDVNWNKASSEQEKRDARSNLIEAEQNLKQVQARRKDLTKQAADAAKIEQTPGVKAAKDNVVSTRRASEQAERALADTRHSAADQAQSDAHNVQMAQRSLADAQKAATETAKEQSVAQLAVASAFQHLSPAGKAFAKYINSLKPRLYEFRNAVQQALLPPIQRGIEAALPLLDTLQTGLVDTATVIGKAGERLGKLFGKDTFRADVASIMASNNRALDDFAGAGFNLVQVLRDLAVVAGPVLLEPFAKWVREVTKGWAAATKAGRATGGLQRFMERAAGRMKNLWHIVRNLTGALVGVGKAAQGSGGSLLQEFEDTTKRWSDWANSDMGQKKMKEFFDAVKPITTAVGNLVANLAEFITLAGGSNVAPVLTFFETLNKIMEGLNKLMALPGVGPVVGQVMALAGVGGALGFVSGKILGLAEGLGKVAKVTGLGKVAKAVGNIGAVRGEGGELVAGTGLGARVKALPGRAARAVGRGTKRAVRAVGRRVGRAGLAAGRVGGRAARGAGRAVAAGGAAAAQGAGRAAQVAGRKIANSARAIGRGAKSLGQWGWGKFITGARNAGKALADGAKVVGRWVAAGARMIGQTVKQAALWTIERAKIIALRGAQLASAAATKAMAGAQRLLNLAMRANPIGLLIGVLFAVGAALVYAYKHFSGFRKVVDKVFGAIVKAAKWLWDVLFGHSIFPDMLKAFGRFFKGVKGVFQAIGKAIRALGGVFKWLWQHAVQPVWALIRKAISLVWNYYYKPIFKLLGLALKALGAVFKWLWQHAVKPAWDKIKSAVKFGWEKVIKPAFDALKKGVGKIAEAFDAAKTAIGKAWDKIRAAVKTPIRAVLNLVNDWVIDKFDWLSKKLGGPHIERISLKGFSGGGEVPGYAPHSKADNVLARLTPGEDVTRVKSAEKMRRLHPGVLEFINKHGTLPAYALGGMVGKIEAYANGGRVNGGGSKVVWPVPGRNTSTYPGHDGVDINRGSGWDDFGDLIRAYRSGRITYAGSGRGYGNAIFEDADNGPTVVYGHTSKMLVKAGQMVRAGQAIGRVGNTGHSTAPHLHFGVPGGTTAGALALLRGATSAPGGTESPGGGFTSFIKSLGGKVAGAVKAPVDWMKNLAKGALDGMVSSNGGSFIAKMLKGLPLKLMDAAGTKIKSLFGGAKHKYDSNFGSVLTGATSNLVSTAAGAAHWTPVVQKALGLLGQPLGYTDEVLHRLMQESGGNPRAVNNWDLNARNGNPSTGLMQVIRGTFASYAGRFKGTGPFLNGVSIDPLANVYAGLNYAMHRYGGSWPSVMMRAGGYDSGGSLYPGSTLAINNTGKTETVFTNENMVDLAGSLATAARALQSLITAPTSAGQERPALVKELTLIGKPSEMPAMLRDAEHQLRVIRQGGVHAKSVD